MKFYTNSLLIIVFLSGIPFFMGNDPSGTYLNEMVQQSVQPIIDRPVRVAVYFEANTSVPVYSVASGLSNHYSEVVSLLESAGHDVSLLTAANILDHELITLNYDVFIIINNLPRENIASLVQDFWLGGGGVLSFNSAMSFLFYYGLLGPELEGTDPFGPYWQNLPAENINISSRHPVTQEYEISDSISITPQNWVTFWIPYWETYNSMVENDLTFLMNNFTQLDYGYGVAMDSDYRGGKVVQLPGDGDSIPAVFESIIVNAVEWLVPKTKGRIAYDLSHQPRLCVDNWDIEFATVYVEINSFSQFRNVLVNHSYTFDKFYPSAQGNFTIERLSAYDVMIIDWPDLNITEPERDAIEEWVSSGGSLILLGDRKGLSGPGPGDEHINYLLDDFGMELSGSDILNDVTASKSAEHPTLEGCNLLGISFRNHITVTEATVQPIWADGGIVVVAAQQYSKGRVVLFSDMNILDNSHLGLYHNELYAINLANWLTATNADVLLYTSSGSYYRSPVVNALNELGLEYHLTFTSEYFVTLLNSKIWSLVIVDESNQDIGAAYSDISGYLDTQGRLLMSSWNMDFYSTDPLWEKLGVEFAEEWDNDEPAFIWSTSHPVFNNPIDYGALILAGSGFYFDDGDKVHVLENATSLAGFTTSESENNSAIVLANQGQTLFNSYVISGLLDDFDDSTYRDAEELWLNEIAFMTRPILDSPEDISFAQGSKGNNITWSPISWYTDSSTYTVEVDSSIYENDDWNGSVLVIDVDGLSPGVHEVKLTVIDDIGGESFDIVQVTVTATLFGLDPTLVIIIGGGFIILVFLGLVLKRRGGSSKTPKKKGKK